MSVFIEVTTDAFQDRFDQIKDAKKKTRRAGADNVRRPLRGLEIKDDTYAILKVINSNGEQIPLVDSGDPTGKSTDYTNFIVQSVQEARMEKHQIVETFGESYIFFFGEAPRFLDVQCVLIDSHDFNWEAEFWENYNRFFRGTKLVEMGARTYLFYDDNIVEGYMLNAQAQKNSQQPLMVQLSFRLYLTNYSNVSLIGDPNFPVRGSLILPPEVSDINEIASDHGKYLATLGANLQNAGFGGGAQFQKAFTDGAWNAGSIPEALYGVFLNATQALGSMDRSIIPRVLAPLRSKIADNKDEMTLASGELTTGSENLHNKLDDVEDLVNQMLEELKNAGSSGNPESMFKKLGFGPRFAPWGRPGGVGVGGGLGASVSFSASASAGIGGRANAGAGASFGASVGASASVGIGGGLGLSGRAGGGFGGGGGFNPSSPYAPNYAQDPTLSKRSAVIANINKASFGDLVDFNYFKSTSFQQSKGYNNGVGVGVGLSLGVGIGGGIGKPFEVRTWSGSGPAPGSFGYAGGYENYGQQLGWGNYGLPAAGGGFSGGDTQKGDQGGYAGAYGQSNNQGGSGGTSNPYGPNPNAYFGSPYNPLFDPSSGAGGYPIGYNSAGGSPFGSPYDPGFGGAPPGFNRGGFSNPYAGPGNGGASVTVVGTPTAFALISTSGSLTPGGGSKTTAYFSTF